MCFTTAIRYDYLSKPFQFAELGARIRNFLRREFVHRSNIISCGNISIDLSKRVTWIDETELTLTKKEFALLEYFLLNPVIAALTWALMLVIVKLVPSQYS